MNREYTKRIKKVIEYIDSNLDKKILLKDVAKVSHFSEFHFHRIFTGIMAETVNDYISRKRLERAICTLIFKPNVSITEVALENGFSSSANFSKAIKNYFGFSPSEIRNPEKTKNSKIGKIFSKYGKDFNPIHLYPSKVKNKVTTNSILQDMNMNVEIKSLENKNICTLASPQGYEAESIFATWDKLIMWAAAHDIENAKQQRFAFCYDNPTVTPANKCRYEASIVIDDSIAVEQPFQKSIIPAGKYAVLYFKGKPEELINAQLGIYSDWFPTSGFEPDGLPMLERYLNDVREDGYIEVEIYVKLKKIS